MIVRGRGGASARIQIIRTGVPIAATQRSRALSIFPLPLTKPARRPAHRPPIRRCSALDVTHAMCVAKPIAASIAKFFFIGRIFIVHHTSPNPENLEHLRRCTAKDDDSEHNGHEHGSLQCNSVLAFNSSRERESDSTPETCPEKHDLVFTRQLFLDGPARTSTLSALVVLSSDRIDDGCDGEDGAVAGCDDGGDGDEDEERLVDKLFLGEETQSEVDENKVLRDL